MYLIYAITNIFISCIIMLLKFPAIYIITNKRNSVLYTGVTSDLKSRIYQHKNKLVKGFSERYNCTKLVYYESADDMLSAITREKQIKGVNSEFLAKKIKVSQKSIETKKTVLNKIQNQKRDLLITLGAGDIDELVNPIKEIYS